MLTLGETPRQYKDQLLDTIKVCRKCIRYARIWLERGQTEVPEFWEEQVIGFNREYIKELIAELVTFKRWQNERGLTDDQEYQYSQRPA